MMHDSGNCYVLNHLVQFTGLTDRTLRNYIASGVLQGEKINGMWHFTPEQVESFISHPSVRPSILAKHHSVIFDFLLDRKKPRQEMCIALDIPEAAHRQTAEFFCYRINQDPGCSLQFSFHAEGGCARIILRGDPAAALALMNEYYAERARL